MIQVYNAKVLCYAEYRTAAIHHACDTAIAPLNKLQDSFLTELQLSSEEALLQFNLAPLESRRDIAMVWIIIVALLATGISNDYDGRRSMEQQWS